VPKAEPIELQRGELVEVWGACAEMLRELADDCSKEAVGQRRALAKVMGKIREIQRRKGD
jgi:hypothetical protein